MSLFSTLFKQTCFVKTLITLLGSKILFRRFHGMGGYQVAHTDFLCSLAES